MQQRSPDAFEPVVFTWHAHKPFRLPVRSMSSHSFNSPNSTFMSCFIKITYKTCYFTSFSCRPVLYIYFSVFSYSLNLTQKLVCFFKVIIKGVQCVQDIQIVNIISCHIWKMFICMSCSTRGQHTVVGKVCLILPVWQVSPTPPGTPLKSWPK